MLKNPFIIYIISFGGVLCAYQLKWSDIYPDLSIDLLFFFIATFFLSLIFAVYISKDVERTRDYEVSKLSPAVYLFLIVGFVSDIAYQGDIPLRLIIEGVDYSYNNFGIPTLHVAIITFGGTFSVIRFSDYLYSKKPEFLIQALMPIIYDILIVNRGAALIAMISWIFIVIIKNDGLGVKKWIITAILLLSALYFFGIVGDIRSGEGGIEEIGKPTESFENLGVPKAYFWTYIYLTSPFANLQEIINVLPHETGSLSGFVVGEMMPDFISKRILPIIGDEEIIKTPLISPALNVTTIYARSYWYLGWIGLIIMFVVLVAAILLYVKFTLRSPYRVPALALLNTLIVFCIFDNMIAFSGMSLQLAWLLLLPIPRQRPRGE